MWCLYVCAQMFVCIQSHWHVWTCQRTTAVLVLAFSLVSARVSLANCCACKTSFPTCLQGFSCLHIHFFLGALGLEVCYYIWFYVGSGALDSKQSSHLHSRTCYPLSHLHVPWVTNLEFIPCNRNHQKETSQTPPPPPLTKNLLFTHMLCLSFNEYGLSLAQYMHIHKKAFVLLLWRDSMTMATLIKRRHLIGAGI